MGVELGHNSRNNALDIFHYFVIPKPQHSITLCIQPFCSALIVNALGFIIVLTTVNLDDELLGMRAEINNIAANWCLLPKVTPTRLHLTQAKP